MTPTIAPMASPLYTDEHGVIRVTGSRVILDLVVSFHQTGLSPEEIVASFPTLPLAKVYAAIGYYLDHATAIDHYLAERETAAAALRRTIEADPKNAEFRELIQARMAAHNQV